MSYNLTWMNQTTNAYDLVSNVNTTVAGIFFNLLFLVLYIIILTQFKGVTIVDGLITSSFIMIILGGLLWWTGLLPYYLASIPLWVLMGALITKAFQG